MAVKLECEICGGKLVGKPGDVFECDSCGMEYSTEWAKQKIQEIKGTVKVEGTVEVTGKVQVEGTSSKDSLLKRAKMCCTDKEWGKAAELLEQVLNADPECGEAYLYCYLIRFRRPTLEALTALFVSKYKLFPTDPNLEKAEKFADERLTAVLNQCRQECANAVAADKKHRQACVGALAERRKALEPVQHLIICGDSHTVGLRADGTVVAVGKGGCCCADNWKNVIAIAGSADRTVGLRADGTVVAVGYYEEGQNMVSDWRNVVAIACDDSHTVGLRADGTVVAVGSNREGQCNVGDWCNVVAIACDGSHTVGLHADGTVVAVGSNGEGQCNVSDWRNVIAIACGGSRTIGLRADGTTVAVGRNSNGQWRDMVAIADGGWHTVGLRADGTVVATGRNDDGQCAVSTWRDVVAIACGGFHTVGLRSDGTVVAVGSNVYGQCAVSTWRDVVAITCGSFQTVALKADGTVAAVGQNTDGQCDVGAWKLFYTLDTIAQEHQRAALQAELANLRGLFNGKHRKELEARLAEIDNELKGLD